MQLDDLIASDTCRVIYDLFPALRSRLYHLALNPIILKHSQPIRILKISLWSTLKTAVVEM
jgi:hypothetical protein